MLLGLALAAPPVLGERPSVEDFFRRPAYSQVTLSPDGSRVAAVIAHRGRGNLAVVDVERKVAKLITDFDVADVLEYHWVGNDRLLLAAGGPQNAAGAARFRGWYAVNVDGSELRAISGLAAVRERTLQKAVRGFDYVGADPDGGSRVLILARERDLDHPDLYRYDTRSGELVLLTADGPGKAIGWLPDRSGVARIATSYDKGVITIWHRANASAPWSKLDEGPEEALKIWPLAFDFDGTLYVAARPDGDREAIYAYDPAARKLGELIARHPEVDLGGLIFNRRKRALVGVNVDAASPGVAWLDEDIARMQRAVDQALPGRVNRLRIASENPARAVVVSYADRVPAHYFVFDAARRTLREIDSSRPSIAPDALGERRAVRYRARDGLEIPAYLTLPKGRDKDLPLIVEIHGGPWVPKRSGGFDPVAQFLASRGYAVLQPDFRGTLGYGRRHLVASFGQWGMAMQDDITDGVEWLVREGIAARGRACLFGASYGGYAALWGLIKTPALYRCGIAAVAVTDIQLMFDISWSDTARAHFQWLEHGARVRIGDPERDREKFRSVSPLHQAERLQAPVLLAYGGADERVPIRHGNAFRAALDRYGKAYEWVVYEDEGHGFAREANVIDFYRRVETFLAKHLN
jgi:dipeptidyl aminopeptidase/acylaminoacyl peptidase